MAGFPIGSHRPPYQGRCWAWGWSFVQIAWSTAPQISTS